MRPEYRKTPRRCPDSPLDVIDSMTEVMTGEMLDISASGLKVMTSAPLQIDALFQWRFPVPDSAQGEMIECGVQVVWTALNPSGRYTVGTRFIQIDRDMRERLRRWCSQSPQ
ncbi:hypothetical protein CO610_04510 [Lysobacteraceae bacterium NML95-0200]|nr:hypothetical protein CO610_04510 [Xanthomonadaceae bacterium NML95-0200]